VSVTDVEFDSDGACLRGTVWSPGEPAASPAVVLVGGSGPTDRTNGGYFNRLRDALVTAGVVVLGYDKRGAGDSTGDWASATVGELAADATAARRVLATHPGVDDKRIGLFGHSEGGWVALRAGAVHGCSFLVLSACPAVPFLDAEIHAMATAGVDPHRAQGLFDDLRSAAHSGADVRTANRLLTDSADAQLRDVLGNAGFTLDEARWAQLRSWIDYTPVLDLRRLTTPTLMVYGRGDALTPIEASLTTLAQLAPSAQVRLFTDADHRVQINGQLAPDYLQTITTWCIEKPDPAE
jgi:pimeloyl-ACP methyl ester carboxylesterase